MLAIKRSQRERMGEPAFVDRMIFYLRTKYLWWIHFIPMDELRIRVVHGIEKGRSYGLTSEFNLTVFVTNMLTIGPDFDKQPAIQRVLTDESIDPDDRMEALMGKGVTDDDWEDSSDMCEPDEYWAGVRAKIESREGG